MLSYPDSGQAPAPALLAPEVPVLGSHRLAAKVMDLIRTLGVSPSEESMAQLRSYEFLASAATADALAAGEDALSVLSGAGIRALVIKGAGIAAVYRKPKWRPYADADVLVHPRDFNTALAALRAEGWERGETTPVHRDFFLRFCLEGVNMTRHGGHRVDLHHAVTPWLWGQRLRFDDLWARSSEIQIGPRSVRVASAEDNFAIACLHLVSDHSAPGKTLMIWQDLFEMARSLDSGALSARMRELGLAAWSAGVLQAAGAEFVDRALLAGLDSSVVPNRFRLRLLLTSSGTKPAIEWAARLPGRCLPLYVFGLVLPSREYLTYHGYDNLLQWWRSRLTRFAGENTRTRTPVSAMEE